MTDKTKEALLEAIKEPLRLLLLAVIPFAMAYVETVSWEFAGALIVILRFIDKLLHEFGKVNKNENQLKGLTQF